MSLVNFECNFLFYLGAVVVGACVVVVTVEVVARKIIKLIKDNLKFKIFFK